MYKIEEIWNKNQKNTKYALKTKTNAKYTLKTKKTQNMHLYAQ